MTHRRRRVPHTRSTRIPRQEAVNKPPVTSSNGRRFRPLVTRAEGQNNERFPPKSRLRLTRSLATCGTLMPRRRPEPDRRASNAAACVVPVADDSRAALRMSTRFAVVGHARLQTGAVRRSARPPTISQWSSLANARVSLRASQAKALAERAPSADRTSGSTIVIRPVTQGDTTRRTFARARRSEDYIEDVSLANSAVRVGGK